MCESDMNTEHTKPKSAQDLPENFQTGGFSPDTIRPSMLRTLAGLWAYTLQKHLIRSRLFNALSFILVVPLVALYAVTESTLESANTIGFYDLAFRYDFLLVLPFTCVASLGGVIREEMQHDTLVFLGTRPVRRVELLGGVYLCQVGFLQILALLHLLVFLGVGSYKSVEGIWQVAPIWFVGQFLSVWVWSALGLALGLISKRYLALAAFYAGLVEIGLYRIPTNIRALSMRVHLESLLGRSQTLQNQFEYKTGILGMDLLALVLGTGVALLIAALLYNYKEYHSTEEMQK